MKCEIGDSVILSDEKKKSKCPKRKKILSPEKKGKSVGKGVFENFLSV